MPNDEAVSKHYSHRNLLKAIQKAITKLGKTIDSVPTFHLMSTKVCFRVSIQPVEASQHIYFWLRP